MSIVDNLNKEHRHLHELRDHLLAQRDEFLQTGDDRTWRGFCGQVRAFASHLDSHFSFEEQDGIFLEVAGHDPKLGTRIDHLREEHEMLRNAVTDLMVVVDREQNDDERRHYASEVLDRLLTSLDEHERAESHLAKDAGYRADGTG